MIDLIGIPFVDKGRDLNGCDCWGLVMLAFARYGVELPNYAISCFASGLIDSQIKSEQARNPLWREVENPVAPCLVTLRTDPDAPDLVTHLGTYIGGGRFLHTMIKRNSVTERLDHPYFINRIEGYYVFAG